MKHVQWLKNILKSLYLSLRRFPLTILLSVSVAAILIAISETTPVEDTLRKVAMVLALGIPLSLSIKLIFERKNEENILKLTISYIIGILLLVLYYIFLLKDLRMVVTTRYIAVSLILYLCFIFIPYLPKRNEFEMYVIALFTGFFTTVIYSIVLYGGLSAILFTIDKLLGIKIQGKVYYYTWLMVVFIFAVAYFLSVIPAKDNKLVSKNYPKLFRILLLYIVMPLLTAYTIILYIYFGKIIATMHWPIGLVSHLVLWYSVIVVVVLFFISPLLSENHWAYMFLKFIPKIILPLLLMMFISISIRIRAYGVTENRYYVVLLALWVFFIMLYFSFIKTLKNILIPITLSFVILISVFGPVSSYSISKYSQNIRFEKILIRNDMIKNGSIQSSTGISKEDRADLSSILSYFDKNHSFKNVKYLPENFKLENMSNVFGFSYENPSYKSPNSYFYYVRSQSEGTLDISGYDYLFDMRTMLEGKKIQNKKPLDASFNYDSSIIKITYNEKTIYSKDLNDFIKKLVDKYGTETAEKTIPAADMNFTEENESIKVKFIFQNITGSRDETNELAAAKGLEFYLLVKIK